MQNVQFFTICSLNYATQVKLLKKSLDRTHPDIPFTMFACDEIDGTIPEGLSGIRILPISATGLPFYEEMCYDYSILELNTAVKPYCFIYLFEKLKADFAVYLDPDLLAVDRMSELFDLIEGGTNIVLTPHTTDPIEDTLSPNDFDMAKAGIYNLGFCGVSASDEGRRFVGWWARKLEKDCRVDLGNGVFVDQKWCDGVPALFDGVAILRHQGYNVGYWNLMHRPYHRAADGRLMAGTDPARLLHFSGVDFCDHSVISKHQNRLTTRNVNAETRDVFAAYKYGLFTEGFLQTIGVPPTLPIVRIFKSSSTNSSYIKTFKTIYNEQGLRIRRPDSSDLYTFSIQEAVAPNAKQPLPDFFYVTYRLRSDLGAAFPYLEAENDALQYTGWWCGNGINEWNLIDEYRESVEFAIDALLLVAGENTKSGIPFIPPHLLQGFSGLRGVVRKRFFLAVYSLTGRFELGLDESSGEYPIPLMLEFLRMTRPDLQKTFDTSAKNGRNGFLNWACTFFVDEYGSTAEIEELLAQIKKSPKDWLRAYTEKPVPSEPAVRREDVLDREAWFRGIGYGLRPAADYPIFDYAESSRGTVAADDPSALVAIAPLKDTVTLIGYSRAEMGMGEHVRNTAAALISIERDFEVFDFAVEMRCGTGNREIEDRLVPQPSGRINLFHINADQTIAADRLFGRTLFEGRYNVGYWAWELERFPNEWAKAIDLVDEIWAPSRFIQAALRKVAGKPVIHMPLRVEPGAVAKLDRSAYGIDAHAFKFLFFFDFDSYHERKNPWSTIDAFTSAFPRSSADDVQLIIKSIGSRQHPESNERLNGMIARDRRIVHIPDNLSGAQMNGLVSEADCFVSLHRSEGFGRGMAEAMAFGRPVIATGYGGNMDFMTRENSLLVEYRLVPIRRGQYPFGEGSEWAEPNVDHAAALMRRVVGDPKEAARLGKAGQQTIRTGHSSAAIARNLDARLREIWKRIS